MSTLIAMCLFSLTMSISPGPVNLMTLSTGVNHGFRQAMPFVSGATIGFTLLLLMTGLGIAQIASGNASFLQVLAAIGSAYIAYLGCRLFYAKPELQIELKSKPGWWQGALLQWLNPKAWTACLAGVSIFQLADSKTALLTFVSLYFVICYASIASWALVGSRVKRLLTNARKLRIFNRIMGFTLILVAVYLLALQIQQISIAT